MRYYFVFEFIIYKMPIQQKDTQLFLLDFPPEEGKQTVEVKI